MEKSQPADKSSFWDHPLDSLSSAAGSVTESLRAAASYGVSRSGEAWSHVTSLSKDTSLTDLAIVGAETVAGAVAARFAAGRLTGALEGTAARKALPDAIIDLKGGGAEFFKDGAASSRATLLNYVPNPFTGKQGLMGVRTVEFRNLDFVAPQPTILEASRGANGVYSVLQPSSLFGERAAAAAAFR